MASIEYLPTNAIPIPIVPVESAPFVMHLDETRRLVRSETRHLRTPAEVDNFSTELAELIEECRRRFGRARVLADWREMTVPSIDVAARLGEAHLALFAEDDRAAVVVGSSVVKSQMRRRFVHAGSRAFLSYAAAELWLTAWR